MGDLALDDLEALGQLGKAVADEAGMFLEQVPALACGGVTRIAQPCESPHLGDRHPGRPESSQERQPQEVDLIVSTAVPRAPDRIDETGSFVVAKRVDAQPGPLSCLADRDTTHGCQSGTWSALQVKPEIVDGRSSHQRHARSAVLAANPAAAPAIRSADPRDDDLVALAAAERAVLVSGDRHLTDLADRLPVQTPAEFLASLEELSS